MSQFSLEFFIFNYKTLGRFAFTLLKRVVNPFNLPIRSTPRSVLQDGTYETLWVRKIFWKKIKKDNLAIISLYLKLKKFSIVHFIIK